MSDKETPIVDLQTFLSGPTTPANTQKVILGKQWHAILEAILFAAPTALTITDIQKILEELSPNNIHQLLIELQQQWNEERRGIELVEVATGWQFRTHPSAAEYIQKMHAEKPRKLSKAAMEALAVIAYRQPVTRGEVEQIRGVDSSAVIHKLSNLNLVQVVGKKEEDPGKPELLGTTPAFLSHFNLRDLLDLPSLQVKGKETESSRPDSSNADSETTLEEIDPLTALQIHLNPEQ